MSEVRPMTQEEIDAMKQHMADARERRIDRLVTLAAGRLANPIHHTPTEAADEARHTLAAIESGEGKDA